MKKLLLSALLGLSISFVHAQSKNFIDQPYIEVSGSADTLVTPNEIFFKIILSEKDTRDRVSLEDLEKRLVDGLRSIGIDAERDLVTTDIASNFRFYLLKSKDVLKAKSYVLKVKDAITATRVFLKLEEMDISNASVDRIDHTEMNGFRNQMLGNAIANAKAKAVALTRPINQVIGAAIHITESDNINLQLQGKAPGVVIRGQASIQANGYADLPKIEFDKIRVAANVSAKFALK